MGHLLRIGVTGGIGSGKSLVCSMFSRLGVPVLSADDIAKQLMRDDSKLRRGLVEVLGPAVYSPDGELDRSYVAAKIFSQPGLHRKVNALVHPRVEAEVSKQFVKMEKAGNLLGIVEAALIFEAGFDSELDYIIVVDSPESERTRRVVARDKMAAADVEKRIQAQGSADSKLRKADYVIRNTGSVEDLESSVRFLHSLLKTVAGKR